jgi:hypothetical protein
MEENEDKVRVVARIAWPIDPGPVSFANNVVAQSDDGGATLYLTFFQTNPPILVGDRESIEEHAENVHIVDAHPIARIALPKSIVPKLISLLNRNTPGEPINESDNS